MLKHTFVICAYKESPYLEACIRSLKKQTMASRIIMVTSTPNHHIREKAEKYKIPLYINRGESGITQDWNFGLSCVKTRYATIAHQDDVYDSHYLELIYKKMRKTGKPVIAFTDYYELRAASMSDKSLMLKIKKAMLLPMRLRCLADKRFAKRLILSMGNPICCPSVTFCMDRVRRPVFKNHFTSNEDWEAWTALADVKGSFVYIPKPLMAHRIHDESTTHAMIQDNLRTGEDFEMYSKFWPKPVAKLIARLYSNSEKFNEA